MVYRLFTFFNILNYCITILYYDHWMNFEIQEGWQMLTDFSEICQLLVYSVTYDTKGNLFFEEFFS